MTLPPPFCGPGAEAPEIIAAQISFSCSRTVLPPLLRSAVIEAFSKPDRGEEEEEREEKIANGSHSRIFKKANTYYYFRRSRSPEPKVVIACSASRSDQSPS